MMRFTMLVTIAAGALCAQASAATELAEREAIRATVLRLFSANDFNALEDLSASYRSTASRTPSGVWHLALFYAGLNHAIEEAQPPSQGEAAFSEAEHKVQRWVAAYPDSPSAHIVYGMLLVARGWSYRGNEYASQVPREAWEPFRRNIALARAYLEEHKSIAAADPHWYKVMLWVAKSEAWDFVEFADLLDEALAREPLYTETYFSALEYLLPKWHGSAFEIEAFARDAAQRTAARGGSGMYARIYWHLSLVEYENDLFTESLVDWPLMREGFEDVIAEYPVAWNVNNFARFACLARDKRKTSELFEQVKDQFVAEAWQPLSLFTECSFWLLLP